MESQCVGLAEAVGLRCEKRRLKRPSAPLSHLPPRFWPRPLKSAEDGMLSPPWPDVVISSGRGSVAAALAVRKASGGKIFSVHIQTPYVPSSRFDLVVIPRHDSLRGENILVTRTALHGVTKAKLAEAADVFRTSLAHLPRPLTAVLVGGSNKAQDCTPHVIHRMADQLIDAVHASGGSLAVTPSRRTGKENAKILKERLAEVPLFFWEGTGDNPYVGLLALADAIVVTSDSVSMVSEACSTGKPVHIFSFGNEQEKLRQFHQGLMDAGVTRSFASRIETWHYDPPNDTERIANVVRERLGLNTKT
jgi:mitochondrial fission protein ELM1